MEDQYFKVKGEIFCRKSCKLGNSLAFAPGNILFTRNEIWISNAEKKSYLKPISKEEFDTVIAPYLEQSKDPSRDVERAFMRKYPSLMHTQIYSSLEEQVEMIAENPERFYTNIDIYISRNEGRIIHLDSLLKIAREYERHELINRIEEVKKKLTEIYSNQEV